MLHVVLDTNVVLSGFLWAGPPAKILQYVVDGKLHLISTDLLIDELEEVLTRAKFGVRLKDIGKTPAEFIKNYRALVEIVMTAELQAVVKGDPDDDIVFACAVAGKADYIVSGDDHLLQIVQYQQIPVLKAIDFLALLETSTDESPNS